MSRQLYPSTEGGLRCDAERRCVSSKETYSRKRKVKALELNAALWILTELKYFSTLAERAAR